MAASANRNSARIPKSTINPAAFCRRLISRFGLRSGSICFPAVVDEGRHASVACGAVAHACLHRPKGLAFAFRTGWAKVRVPLGQPLSLQNARRAPDGRTAGAGLREPRRGRVQSPSENRQAGRPVLPCADRNLGAADTIVCATPGLHQFGWSAEAHGDRVESPGSERTRKCLPARAPQGRDWRGREPTAVSQCHLPFPEALVWRIANPRQTTGPAHGPVLEPAYNIFGNWRNMLHFGGLRRAPQGRFEPRGWLGSC